VVVHVRAVWWNEKLKLL